MPITIKDIVGNSGGTTNYLPKFTPNGFKFGNSQIFDNGSSVGIGTATPNINSILEAVSASDRGIRVSSNSGTAYTGGKFQMDVGGGTWDMGFSAPLNAMTLLTKGSSTGNFIFGYGTEASPTSKLAYTSTYGGIGVNVAFASIVAVGHFKMPSVGSPTDKIIFGETFGGTDIFAVYNNGSITKNGLEISTSADLALKADKLITFNAQTASYVLVLADANLEIIMNVGSANTLTVPPNGTVAFPIGTQILVTQYGTGTTTITPGVGVTINSYNGYRTAGQYAYATLIKRNTNEWDLTGNTII